MTSYSSHVGKHSFAMLAIQLVWYKVESTMIQVTLCFTSVAVKAIIGLLQLVIAWYKIRHAGGQAYYYSRTGTKRPEPVKVDLPLL